MNLRNGQILLLLCIVVFIFGGYFVQARIDRDRRIESAFSLEDRHILAQGQQFALYYLDPEPDHAIIQEGEKTKPTFHNFVILGQERTVDAATRAKLLAALYDGVGKGDPAMCFNPRHGIHAVRDKKVVDLVICFECGQIEIFDANGNHGTTMDSSSKEVFNRALSERSMP